MALVGPPSRPRPRSPPLPLPSLRRSSRISVRRQISPPPPPPQLTDRNASIHTSFPRIAPSLPSPPSPPRPRPIRRDPSRLRSRTRGTSPRLPSKPLPLPLPAADPQTTPRAGTKRKRPATLPSDHSAQPHYELVLAATPSTDGLYQTPRQLRYAKRQRLLSSHSHSPLLPSQDAALCSALHRPLSHPDPAPVPTPQPPDNQSLASQTTSEHVPSHLDLGSSSDTDGPEQTVEDEDAPIFTPLSRLPVPWRTRPADSTDPTLWKSICQERVEHLKRVYRDIFRAVVHAEALAAQEAHAKAVASASHQLRVQPELENAVAANPDPPTQFEHYTPPEHDVDADGDTTMEDASSSSEDSSDPDLDSDTDSDDDDSDSELDSDADSIDNTTPPPSYEKVLILTPAQPDGAPTLPRLPRLSSIRVFGLDPHPPSTRDGVPFIGRGTPADRQRLADWAAPAPPLRLRTPSPSPAPIWAPEPLYFTQDMVPEPALPAADLPSSAEAGMRTAFGMDVLDGAHPNGLSWLDPALRAESLSPSPTPAPTAFPDVPPSPVAHFDIPAHVPVGFPFPSPPSAYAASPSPGPLSPTGCALHESFLECLQAPGCAGPTLGASPPFLFSSPSPSSSSSSCLSSCPSSPPSPSSPLSTSFSPPSCVQSDASSEELFSPPTLAPPASVAFPNQELAQFVRSHLSPGGSVTLGHALG
ncbi:hypothetical protein BD414DRAFT_539095 [Trametes punicea]|nr:hypothetical protein BD414DRAFT_539095 [Trametes punicea]